jgi:hypothetical protein
MCFTVPAAAGSIGENTNPNASSNMACTLNHRDLLKKTDVPAFCCAMIHPMLYFMQYKVKKPY